MSKIWEKSGTSTANWLEKFTVGKDPDFDMLLAPYDVEGSMAHVKMLESVGLVNHEESKAMLDGLQHLLMAIQEGTFSIEPGVEDVHSQVEQSLFRMIGTPALKLHTGRSRNDQVALDIKLFLRAELLFLRAQVEELFYLLLEKADLFKTWLMPGYTHLQVAMPSSFGMWYASWAEALVDDTEHLATAWRLCNKNPLGSGAGYGSSFPLDRDLTTALLGMSQPHINPIYAQLSRGKTEHWVAMSLSSLAATLGKLGMDATLYLNQNFGFFKLPSELTTGSSLMPHKQNADGFEILRARCSRIQAVPNEMALLRNNLPSGYHRDIQLSKEILFPAIQSMRECLEAAIALIHGLQPQQVELNDAKYAPMFSVEAVNDLVNQGLPFREAYKIIGDKVLKGETVWPSEQILKHTHLGSIGNPGLDRIRQSWIQMLHQWA